MEKKIGVHKLWWLNFEEEKILWWEKLERCQKKISSELFILLSMKKNKLEKKQSTKDIKNDSADNISDQKNITMLREHTPKDRQEMDIVWWEDTNFDSLSVLTIETLIDSLEDLQYIIKGDPHTSQYYRDNAKWLQVPAKKLMTDVEWFISEESLLNLKVYSLDKFVYFDWNIYLKRGKWWDEIILYNK